MQSEHYIGITGLAFKSELTALEALCGRVALPTGYRLNVGILVSDQTFSGGESELGMFPSKTVVYNLIEKVPDQLIPVIHYNTTSTLPLSEQVLALFSYNGIYERNICRTIQLNVKHPDPSELEAVRNALPRLQVILQVPLWRDELSTSSALFSFINSYIDLVNQFLFDPSGGRGSGLSDEQLDMISSVAKRLPPDSGVAIAGGVSGKNVVEFCRRISQSVGSRFSIDAQGRLRGGKFEGRRIGDQLNPDKVHLYVSNAATALLQIAIDITTEE